VDDSTLISERKKDSERSDGGYRLGGNTTVECHDDVTTGHQGGGPTFQRRRPMPRTAIAHQDGEDECEEVGSIFC
jgi:hypothetical protein